MLDDPLSKTRDSALATNSPRPLLSSLPRNPDLLFLSMTTITDQSSLPAALSPSSSSPSSSSPPSSSPSSSSPSSSSPFSSVCFSSVSPSSSLPSSSVSSASLSSLASGGKLPGSETSEESLPHQQGAEPRVSLEATMCSPSPEKTGPPCSPCPESCGKQEGNNTDPCTVSSPCESRGSRRKMETARAGASSGKAEDEHARAEGGEPAQGTHEARDKEKGGDRRPASGPGGSELDKMEKEDGKTFPSKLDFFDANSDLARSDFRGVAVLLFIAAIFYLVANPILRWYDSKEFVDPSLARAMFDDFFFLMFMWAKLFAWSFTAYHLHLLYLRGRISRRALLFLQHLTQSAAIGYAVCSCLYNAWPIIPAAFVQMIAVVQFMKMHSYSSTNMNFCDDMRQGKQTLGYPENVTLRNFCDYLFCPVLVYEPMYRRGGGFRPTYFVFKLFSMVGAMVVMYLACTSYLIPTMMRSPSMSITEAIFSLVFPFLFLDILIFYILFECICNLAAEITNFANRNFYDDWWNSTNWDEYSRKWNKPVHRFLLRHVYMETQQRYKWSHQTAAFATFLFSALLHEMILDRLSSASPTDASGRKFISTMRMQTISR